MSMPRWKLEPMAPKPVPEFDWDSFDAAAINYSQPPVGAVDAKLAAEHWKINLEAAKKRLSVAYVAGRLERSMHNRTYYYWPKVKEEVK